MVSACLGAILVLVELALCRAGLVVASDQRHHIFVVTFADFSLSRNGTNLPKISALSTQRERVNTDDSHSLTSFFGTLTDVVNETAVVDVARKIAKFIRVNLQVKKRQSLFADTSLVV